jgi:hypothetical protein
VGFCFSGARTVSRVARCRQATQPPGLTRAYTVGALEPSYDPLPYATRLRWLTATEYMRIVDAGVFGAHERLELIEGVLCRKSPQSW